MSDLSAITRAMRRQDLANPDILLIDLRNVYIDGMHAHTLTRKFYFGPHYESFVQIGTAALAAYAPERSFDGVARIMVGKVVPPEPSNVGGRMGEELMEWIQVWKRGDPDLGEIEQDLRPFGRVLDVLVITDDLNP